MSWKFFDMGYQVVESQCQCAFCFRNIKKGTKNIAEMWAMWQGQYQKHFYMCNFCKSNEEHLIKKGKMLDFWDAIPNIFTNTISELKHKHNCDIAYYLIPKEYICFVDNATGEELHRVHMPISGKG